MTGVVNTTGARSGVVGTISAPAVGTGTDGYVFTGTGAGANPAWEAISAGKALQCLSKHHGGVLSTTSLASSDAWGTWSDLWISITPAASSKVLVICQINVSGTNYNDPSPVLALFRDSTKIGMGASASNRARASVGTTIFSGGYNSTIEQNISWNYLDTPGADGTTAYVYKIAAGLRGTGSGTVHVNQSPSDSDSSENQRSASNITVLEIGA